MSTDLQQYSTENQLDRIKRYAEQRDFRIIRIIEDAGRNGLTLDNRDGLQDLMKEVQSGSAEFEAILVYDVSRWGRFQDADEGAYYEHCVREPAFGFTTVASNSITTAASAQFCLKM
jgi:DNA invertase Pin-like site-specific DNA recombinase